MPTKKIQDLAKLCLNPCHNPPGHMVYESGVYEHTCPGCGAVKIFTVTRPVW